MIVAMIAAGALMPLQLAAQTPPPARGFTPPGTSFGSNPFAGKPGGKGDDLFEPGEDNEDFDEPDDVSDISDEILRQRMEERLRARGNKPGGGAPMNRSKPGGGSGIDFNNAANDVGATSTTGGANSRITPGAKGPACLKLDPYSGYGPDVITNFDFPDADIVEIAKTLGRLTCLNFILDKDVKGRISVVSNSSITVGDAWKAFLTALDVNGFSLIPSGAYIRIARQRDAKDKQIKTYSGDYSPDNDLYITRVLPLKYISADEVSRVFRNFMPPNTRIISYDQTNTLIITDTGSNIKKIVDMVQLLDVEGYDEGLEVISIKYASAQDIAKLIDQLLPGSAGSGPGQPGGVPGIPRFRSGSGFAARKTKEGGVISHIIPDDRTNSVIVSANAKGLEQVKELIRKLDAKITASQGGNKIHVVYLQFADAEQVATTLNNLAQGASRPPGGVNPVGGAPTSATATLFEGSIKISADKPTNSLVITGTASDYQTVGRVIAKLDVPRDQVYVEAVIMEINLNKDFVLATSIAAPTSGVGFLPNQDFANFLQNPFSVPGLLMGFQSGKGGKSIDLGNGKTANISNVAGLIKALQSNSSNNVLATPQLLTLDNQEASIEISENIPVPTVTAVQGTSSTGITKEKVSLTLKIKPQINKISNFVKLDIDQKIEDIDNRNVPSALQATAFATTSRQSKTTVVVQDGDTVAMGGLVRDKVTENSTKVPLLGDIPLLGWLFRSKETISAKQNLLVFMTPQIIKQYQHVRKILDKKLRQRDEFLEKNNGGEDSFQDSKLDLVKSLPPVGDLKSGGRVENADLEPNEDVPPADDKTPKTIGPRTQGQALPPGTAQPGTSQSMDGATAPGVLPQNAPFAVPAGTAPGLSPGFSMTPGVPTNQVPPATTVTPSAPTPATPPPAATAPAPTPAAPTATPPAGATNF
ncbi:MAG: type II secretion system secretin GspD [Deltaproteobacteria bacterium]|nr:type II secretion system secretin GspD [Deltaproteobacteria bacterium]